MTLKTMLISNFLKKYESEIGYALCVQNNNFRNPTLPDSIVVGKKLFYISPYSLIASDGAIIEDRRMNNLKKCGRGDKIAFEQHNLENLRKEMINCVLQHVPNAPKKQLKRHFDDETILKFYCGSIGESDLPVEAIIDIYRN